MRLSNKGRQSVGACLFACALAAVVTSPAPSTAAVGSATSAPNFPSTYPAHAEGLILVKFRGLSPEAVGALNRQFGVQNLGIIPGIGVYKLAVPLGATVDEMVAAYGLLAEVVFAEPVFIATIQDTAPSDALFSQQWGLAKAMLPAAWDLERGNFSIVVAVVDTGVDCTHPDLQGRCVAGFNTMHGQRTQDDHGHGTHVSGILGALTDNTTGVAGVNWQVAIMPVKALDKNGSGTYSDVSEAIVGAADRGARVINLSLGGYAGSETLKAAVDYAWGKGVFLACAAGNTGGSLLFPAAYPNCTAVGATDQNDNKASFSSYGAGLAVTAPGVAILSTVPNTGATCCTDSSGYKSLSGTSMATPHVAGLAALLFNHFLGANNADVRNQIEAYADDLGTKGWDGLYGYGRINAYRALANPLAPPVPLPPSIKIESPASGSTVSNTVTVKVVLGGAFPFDVSIRANNKTICNFRTSSTSASCVWNSQKGPGGTYRVEASLTDGNGASALDSVDVIVTK